MYSRQRLKLPSLRLRWALGAESFPRPLLREMLMDVAMFMSADIPRPSKLP